jgi:hypothetical protein
VDGPFKILLGPGTVNYKVVTDETDIVLDLGTDNTINERPKRGQWGYTEEFTDRFNQMMKKGNNFSIWNIVPFEMELLPPTNYLYLPFMGR